MKTTIRRLLVLLFTLALTVGAQAAYNTETEQESLLPRTKSYGAAFDDVNENSWYYPYVVASYEYSLIFGHDESFAPDDEITVAELLTITARTRAFYTEETIPAAVEGEAWFMPYVRYLTDRGLLDVGAMEYRAPATRAQLAGIFAAALPEECFNGLNATIVADAYASGDYITDVNEYTPYQQQILWLYREGLSAGVDDTGSYWPDKTTTRAEAAAIVTRMIEPPQRLTPSWDLTAALTPAEQMPETRTPAGTTLSSLIEAPEQVTDAPDCGDFDAIDALARQMLAEDKSAIRLSYEEVPTHDDAMALAVGFTSRVKSYCEQMYNTVLCQVWSSGAVDLMFSATACTDEELAQYRAETMAKALEIREMLWATGQLREGMSQYERAKVCYLWLCDYCTYDWDSMYDESALSHIAYSALVNGVAVCDGYTGAYNLLLKLEGIDCYAMHNSSHIWTVATLDGQVCHIDTTWGDQTPAESRLRYFAMTEQQAYATHPW